MLYSCTHMATVVVKGLAIEDEPLDAIVIDDDVHQLGYVRKMSVFPKNW